jgi:hypothetical protein
MFRIRFSWNYRGHERRLWARGPNWWQITIGRFAFIRVFRLTVIDRQSQ